MAEDIPVLDLVSAWPGERYRLRFLGPPRAMPCIHVTEADGRPGRRFVSEALVPRMKEEELPPSMEWAAAALDYFREDELSLVLISDSLICRLANYSRMTDLSIGGLTAPEVVVDVVAGTTPYFLKLLEETVVEEGVMEEAPRAFGVLSRIYDQVWQVRESIAGCTVVEPQDGCIRPTYGLPSSRERLAAMIARNPTATLLAFAAASAEVGGEISDTAAEIVRIIKEGGYVPGRGKDEE